MLQDLHEGASVRELVHQRELHVSQGQRMRLQRERGLPVSQFLLCAALALLAVSSLARADQVVPSDRVVTRVIVRAEPSSTGDRIGSLSPGETAEFLDDVPSYYKVRLTSGVEGFVSKAWTDLVAGPPSQPTQPAAAGGAGASTMTAHFIDLLQGDSTLLEFPCAAVLIDAGGENSDTTQTLVDYLSAFFRRRTDLNQTIAVEFTTHTHVDHNRALRKVVETFKVERYVHNGTYNGSGSANAKWMRDHANDDGRTVVQRSVEDSEVVGGGNKSGLTDGTIDPVDCGQVDPKITVLSGHVASNPGWPQGEFANQNNHSLVIRVDFGSASFLFSGDLEEPAIETLVDYYDGTPRLNIDVYHVGHHGSYNGSTTSFLGAMSPKVALISVGPFDRETQWTAWQYGHPRDTAVDMLEHAVSLTRPSKRVHIATAVKDFKTETMTKAIYATGWDGNVDITARMDGTLAVTTAR